MVQIGPDFTQPITNAPFLGDQYSPSRATMHASRLRAENHSQVHENHERLAIAVYRSEGNWKPAPVGLDGTGVITWTAGTKTAGIDGMIEQPVTASVDVSAFLWPGCLVAFGDAQGTHYFIVTQQGGAGITCLGPTNEGGIGLPSAITSMKYAPPRSMPPGFPLNPQLWECVVTNSSDQTDTSPTSAWAGGGTNISVPAGIWDIGLQCCIEAQANTTAITAVGGRCGLSTTLNGTPDQGLVGGISLAAGTVLPGGSLSAPPNTSALRIRGMVNRSVSRQLAGATTYYLVHSAGATAESFAFLGNSVTPTQLRARSLFFF